VRRAAGSEGNPAAPASQSVSNASQSIRRPAAPKCAANCEELRLWAEMGRDGDLYRGISSATRLGGRPRI
jgi:hypothetical protein